MRFSSKPLWSLASACICVMAIATTASAQEIRNGEELLRAMHDRYQGNWYQTLTFTQKSTTYKPDGTTQVETWHEAASLPGKLRIDMGTPGDGNGVVLADGTMTSFKESKVSGTRPFVHMLLVLGFDVYCQDPQTTLKQVKEQGFDLAKLHQETWEGEPVYVVGADKGDLKSKQFWIEKKRLLFVRMIEPAPQDNSKIADTRFGDYRRLPVGWVAARVELYVNDRKVFGEEYSEIQANPKLDLAVFDPQKFNATHWEK